tara:strand:+ start:474 stop:752 length:279 start_codon:yes stop_codon:yes gene_type:complete
MRDLVLGDQVIFDGLRCRVDGVSYPMRYCNEFLYDLREFSPKRGTFTGKMHWYKMREDINKWPTDEARQAAAEILGELRGKNVSLVVTNKDV